MPFEVQSTFVTTKKENPRMELVSKLALPRGRFATAVCHAAMAANVLLALLGHVPVPVMTRPWLLLRICWGIQLKNGLVRVNSRFVDNLTVMTRPWSLLRI